MPFEDALGGGLGLGVAIILRDQFTQTSGKNPKRIRPN